MVLGVEESTAEPTLTERRAGAADVRLTSSRFARRQIVLLGDRRFGSDGTVASLFLLASILFVSDDADSCLVRECEGPVGRSFCGQPAYAFITDDGRVETYVGSLGGDGLAEVIEKLIVA